MNGRILTFGYDADTRRDAINGFPTGPRVVKDERPCEMCGELTEEAVWCDVCNRTIGVGD